jgi:hypothetical protein
MKPGCYSKILAMALCLLLAPGAGAAEPANGTAQPAHSDDASSAVDASSAAKDAAADPAQLLTAEESSELSQRAEEPGQEVIGGALSNLHLTYIVIALAAAVIVLIAK